MRWALRLFIVAVLLLAMAPVAGWFWLRGSLPETNGEVALAGLEGEVEILRDARGVPHIYAQSDRDAYFAVGFVHAQDRLWQMEFQRRLGAGRLSELIADPAVLQLDKFMRTVGFYRSAEEAFASLSPEGQAALEAYAAGVNAFLDNRSGPLPVEYAVTGVAPEPWRPEDSLVWLKLMSWSLSYNWEEELLRARMEAAGFPPGRIAALFPEYPVPGRAPRGVEADGLAGLYEGLDLKRLAKLPEIFPVSGAASNNWAVNGARSEDGKPLLANDPHLGLSIPSVWYLLHVEAPGFRFAGASLPSQPVPTIGHNGRIAIGLTNVMADVQDLYVERIDPEDPQRYLTPGGSSDFITREETIRVKGSAPVTITVRETRHGPVISDLVADGEVMPARPELGEEAVLALAWAPLAPVDRTFDGQLALVRAQNWAEAEAAAGLIDSVYLNLVYADAEGHIAYRAVGRIPQRDSGDPRQGRFPSPGWEREYDWSRDIPVAEMPRVLDPAAGLLATSNHRVVGDAWPYYLGSSFVPGYRQQRILDLLQARTRHDVASFRNIQLDQVSLFARELLPYLNDVEPWNGRQASVLALMLDWNGAMRRDRPEPLIFAAWHRALERRLFADELGELYEDWAGVTIFGLRPVAIATALREDSNFCDDVTTSPVEDCETQAAQALEDALEELTASFGEEVAGWRWGTAHKAFHDHRPFGQVPGLSGVFAREIENGGGVFTVNVGTYNPGDAEHPYRQIVGPSLRMIVPLGDPGQAQFMITTGQSGNRLSEHYDDMVEPWRDGVYLPMPMARAGVDALAVAKYVLRPID